MDIKLQNNFKEVTIIVAVDNKIAFSFSGDPVKSMMAYSYYKELCGISTVPGMEISISFS